MAKIKRRNKGISAIILIIFISLLTISIVANAFVYLKSSSIDKEVKTLKSNYKTEQNNLKIITDEIAKYQTDIEEYENIDENILKVKDTLFDNIKALEDKIQAGQSDKKIAYFTFDDGPYYSTYKVLDILKQNNVKATFFLIGQGKDKCYDNKSANCYDVIKSIAEGGHTLANHTYSHAIFKGLYSSTNNFISNIEKQEELLKKYTNDTINITRFPGGSSTAGRLKSSIIEELRKRNYGWVDWTAQDGDGGQLSSKDQAWRNFTSSINSDIEVILLHDYNNYSIALLPDMIKYLKDKGYLILPLSYKSNMVNK